MRYPLRTPYGHRAILATVTDALCFLCAAGLTWFTARPPLGIPAYLAVTGFGLLASLVALHYCDAYRPRTLGSGRETIACAMNAMGTAFVMALVLYFAVRTPPGTVAALAQMAGFYFPLFLAARLLFRFTSSLPRLRNRVLVIGASDLGIAIAEEIRNHPNLGTEFVGFLSDDPELIPWGAALVSGFPVLGQVHHLEKVVRELDVHWIVVASKSREEHFPAEALLAGKLSGRRVESGLAFYERLTGKIYLRDLRPSYLIFSDGFRSGRASAWLKRVLDLAVAAPGLLLAAPLLALCAIAIRLESRGPALYRQQRLGRDGRCFTLFKLRSMEQDAEARSGAIFASEEDDRITRVGSFLRKTRLDEVPQLWNVIRGDMSLVGPRPERPEFSEKLAGRYPYFASRVALKPGITGWAQIHHGYVNDVPGFEEKLALDLFYMKWRSLLMDMVILWQTVKTVLLLRGI